MVRGSPRDDQGALQEAASGVTEPEVSVMATNNSESEMKATTNPGGTVLRVKQPKERRDRRRQYERNRYHEIMEQIREKLGNKCALASHDCEGGLQVDHPNGRDWDLTKVSSLKRARRLEQELRADIGLRLLCAYHNGWHGYTHLRGRRR